jgi:threonine synthase
MEFVTGLRCVFCGVKYSTRIPYTCPACGITGTLDVQYDYLAIARSLTRRSLAKRAEYSHWRYRELAHPQGRNATSPCPVWLTPIIISAKR